MTFGTRPRRSSRPWQDAQQTQREKDQDRRRRTWACHYTNCPWAECSTTCWAQLSALKLCHGPPVQPFFFLSAAGALLWLVLAVGKRVRARLFGLFSSFLLPAHSFGFFPFPFCCRRTPLVGARCGQTSAAWKSAGSDSFVAGRSLWTDSLTACWTQTRREAAGRGGAGGRRTPLVRARCGEASAASKRAGREAVLAGCALGTDSVLLSI